MTIRGSVAGRNEILRFSKASRPDVGPKQPPVQWVPGAPGLVVRWRGCQVD